MSILVFGSLNMDLVTQTPRLPLPGETLLGSGFATVPGGKGANQAVAAARLGSLTHLVGRVGGDAFGQALIANLQTAGVTTDAVQVDLQSHSGVAAIAVATSGENHIIVVPGANERVDATDLHHLRQYLTTAQILLLQFEIPLTSVWAAAQAAHAAQVPVMVDPAPMQPIPDHAYGWIDILTPNQVEAGQLLGCTIATIEDAIPAAQTLHQRGIATVVIKLGAAGVVCCSAAGTFHQPAFGVPVVDTVAAGDAFNGGLAVGLADGLSLPQAIRFATAVAALSVTQSGAQPSMPTRTAVNTFLQTQPSPT